MTIDDAIREAAVSGRLVGLTIWKTADGQFQASISPDRQSWSIETASDPVTALQRVLGLREPPPTSTGAFD